MATLPGMEIRNVDRRRREIDGIVAVYGETTRLVADPGGERILPGCFTKSIRQRETRIPLCVNHDHSQGVGMSRAWRETTTGLEATFVVRSSDAGDQALADVEDGYLCGLSIGFAPLTSRRAPDGAIEHREAKLAEVSLVLIGAYEGATILAVRAAARQRRRDEILEPFLNPPAVNLDPVDLSWLPGRR